MKKNLLRTSLLPVLAVIFLAFTPQDVKFEQPVLITSAGQSADVKLVNLLARREGLQAETKLMATAEDLNGIKTLIIVPGFSSKGLGAAGISQQDEMARVEALVKAAGDRNIPIVMMHVGGKARRGGQSDGFCQLIAENSKSMIVVEQGNEDGFFTRIASSHGIPMKTVDKISSAAGPMGELF